MVSLVMKSAGAFVMFLSGKRVGGGERGSEQAGGRNGPRKVGMREKEGK